MRKARVASIFNQRIALLPHIAAGNGKALVCRAVVHHDKLKIPKRLRPDRFDGILQPARTVQVRDDDACLHSPQPPSRIDGSRVQRPPIFPLHAGTCSVYPLCKTVSTRTARKTQRPRPVPEAERALRRIPIKLFICPVQRRSAGARPEEGRLRRSQSAGRAEDG